MYGLTELAGVISVLSAQAHRDPAREDRLTSAGRLVAGAELRVVDPATGRDVAAGQPGEFWFRSAQRMMGYLNRPEDTAAAITAAGWLRSGDIGHVDDGGFPFVSDRVKDMIITGGENVYSPEVERAVAEHPAVAEVAVIGVPDDQWGESVRRWSCSGLASRRPRPRSSRSPASASRTTSARAPSTSLRRCRARPAGRCSSGPCAPRTGPDGTGRSDRYRKGGSVNDIVAVAREAEEARILALRAAIPEVSWDRMLFTAKESV